MCWLNLLIFSVCVIMFGEQNVIKSWKLYQLEVVYQIM
jgi:hypothetical protein